MTDGRLARSDLGHLLTPAARAAVLSALETATGASVKDLSGRKRDAATAAARHVAAWILWKRGLSYSEVGRILGGRDHTTAMSSVRVVESARAAGEADRLRTDRAYTIFRVLEPEASAATPTVPTAKELRAALAEVQRARAALDRIEARLKELGAADAPEEVSHGT